jgi:hypothetical protein
MTSRDEVEHLGLPVVPYYLISAVVAAGVVFQHSQPGNRVTPPGRRHAITIYTREARIIDQLHSRY